MIAALEGPRSECSEADLPTLQHKPQDTATTRRTRTTTRRHDCKRRARRDHALPRERTRREVPDQSLPTHAGQTRRGSKPRRPPLHFLNPTAPTRDRSSSRSAARGRCAWTRRAATSCCASAGASCAGTVSSGSPVDTSSFGAKSFTVTATDNVGNTSTQTVTYNVTYNVCLAYNPKAVYQAGSTIPIKPSVCDPNGNNLSSPAIALRAVGVGLVSTAVFGDVDSSGGANPDGDFRLVGGFYVFNMSTKGLGTGSYYLYFTAGSDPTLHAATFQLK